MRLLAVRQLRDEHALQCVNSAADVAIADFLVEHKTEAIAPFSILARCCKRMESRFDVVLLGAEAEALRKGELRGEISDGEFS